MPLATELFDYSLPPQLIAQTPTARRDHSRLLVVDRGTQRLEHTVFAELPRFLRAGDVLIRNNAAVLPARLHAQRPTGGQVECFLLRPRKEDGGGFEPQFASPSNQGHAEQVWRCLAKPGRRLPVGATFAHSTGAFSGEIIAKEPEGTVIVRFSTPDNEAIAVVANRLGEIPLPPYIERPENSPPAALRNLRQLDRERYQTVYANPAHQVAVAAPTAGLHFTPELFAKLETQGVRAVDITLHVGLGTFKPISTPTIEEHAIHRELCEIPAATQRALLPPSSGRRVAVGTTSVRTIEDFCRRHSAPLADEQTHFAEAEIFIYPPQTFRGVDALITNFHQPRSTLLCLVAAFLTPGSADGIAWIRQIYTEAIAREYRFFSYGDAMLIL